MKIRFLFCAAAVALAAISSAQRTAQSDVTVPSVMTFFTSIQVQSSDTTVNAGSVNSVFGSEPTGISAPGQIPLFELPTSLLASMEPALPRQQTASRQALVDTLNKSIQSLNKDLSDLHTKQIPLSQYNHMITQNRRCLKSSLALAKYLKANPSSDSADEKELSVVVAEMERLNLFLNAVNKVLGKM